MQEACARTGRNGVRIKAGEIETDTSSNDPGDLDVGELGPDESPIAVEKAHVAVPEHSHPGESQSDGLWERAVQQLVDHIRVMKSAWRPY